MPERINKKFRKVDSADVQGEGSWVIVRNIGFEIIKSQNITELQNSDQNMDLAYQAAKSILYEWNWVNDEGEPMPQPKDNRDIFDELTIEEQWFILKAANLDKLGDLAEEAKN